MQKTPARRTAWGGEIYNGVTTMEPHEFFTLKRESIHTNTALLRKIFKYSFNVPLILCLFFICFRTC